MRANRVSFSFEKKSFLTVLFILFLSVACLGQSDNCDVISILAERAQQEMKSNRLDDCIMTCIELENKLLKSNQTNTQIYVECLYTEVSALYLTQKYSAAIPQAEKALKILEKISGTNTKDYANFISLLGSCYFNINPLKSAECQKIALRIYENVYKKNSKEYLRTIGLLATSLVQASKYDEAYDIYKKRLSVIENSYTKKSEEYIDCLMNLAMCAHYLKHTNEVLFYSSQARDIAKQITFSNKDNLTSFLYQYALLIEVFNRPEAIMTLEECASILENNINGNARVYINCISHLGLQYQLNGNLQKAYQCFKKEATLCKNMYGENSIRYARALLNVADCLKPSEKYEMQHIALQISKKESYFKDSSSYIFNLINIARNTSSYARILKNIGQEERALSINKEALNEIQEAIEIIKHVFGNDHFLMFDARQILSTTYCNMSKYKEAISVAKENLQNTRANYGKDSYSYAKTLAEIAYIYSQAKMYKEAIKYDEESLSIFKKLGDYSSDEWLISMKGLLYDRFSVDSNDSTIVSLYTDYLERLKDNVIHKFGWMTSEERHFFWEEKGHFDIIHVLLKEDYLRKNNSQINELCYNSLLLLKGLLLNCDIDYRVAIEKSADSSIKADYQKLVSKRIEFDDIVKRNNYDEQKIDYLSKEIIKIERSLAQKLLCIDNFNKDICINFQDIHSHLQKDEVIVDFYKHFDTYFAFVISYDSNQVNVFKVCSEQDIAKLYKNKCYETDSLYIFIWKPLESVIDSASTVYFIPDGGLYSLALESADLQHKRIYHRLSSSRQICLERDQHLGKEVVIYGGIDYDADSYNQKRDETQQNNTLRSLRETLDYLPGSQKEAKVISSILCQNGFKVKLLTGHSASEESFKKLSDTNVNVLHVSTHGFCWSQEKYESMISNNPLLNQGDFYQVDEDLAMIRTGLMFAGANNAFINKVGNTGLDDGILTAKEICNLNSRNNSFQLI